ncbi:DUF3717 domain-containing protein [Paraburkholderia sp. CNPSo 3076]|uniref:DUF3717 domain-containing protein n=1 Tax=Paraburkholderia sp. CNPSo 3076 TaxID=2940936 RepID=UPI00225107A0|nr:DUF3717 domain-containing protein [Paraburkholderia sp. CNPSo 3076]MCX5545483.1 DUF3717 domain-containing protein [Paraburkholderia sp. CNPSo 3076]
MYPQPFAVTIAQIESAINHWRERRPAAAEDQPVLCAETRALADVYGLLIYSGATSVEYSTLNAGQRDALAATLR